MNRAAQVCADLRERTLTRVDDVPSDRDYDVGFRCARAAAP